MIQPREDGPRVITLWASGRCNFRCQYCIHGGQTGREEFRSSFSSEDMSWSTFERAMEQTREFSHRPDSIVFCGIGEPLLNDRLPQMITYIKKNKLASFVEVTTNGSLLTHERSLALAEAGLDSLNLSLQGITEEMYREICGYPCQIDKLREQIEYFYRHKGSCHVHVKIMDTCLKPGEEKIFNELFSEICDTFHIDSVVPLFPEVDYGGLISQVKDQYTGEKLVRIPNQSCRLLLLSLFIQADGQVVPCCIAPDPAVYGNIYSETLLQIWNGFKRKELVNLHKSGRRQENPVCAVCVQPDILC